MLKKQKILSPFTVAVLANVMLGSSTVAFKFGLDSIDPLVFSGIRYVAIGFLMLAMFGWGFSRIKDKAVIGKLLLNALFVGLFAVLWALGLDQSTAIKAALLSLSTPIMMYLMSLFLLHEPVIKRALAGCIVGLIGSILMVGLPAIGAATVEVGDVMLLCSYFFLALAIIHAKHLYRWLKPTEIVTYRLLASGLVILSFMFLTQGAAVLEGVTTAGWIALIYSITISGALALPLFYWALKKMPAEDLAPIFYIDPLTGAVGSALLLGDTLEPAAIAGVAIVIAGLMISHPHHHHLFHRLHVNNHHMLTDLKRWLGKVAHHRF